MDRDLDELQITAYHEAGHWVMNILQCGGLPRHARIVPDGKCAGSVGGAPMNVELALSLHERFKDDQKLRHNMCVNALTLFASAAACYVHTGDDDVLGCENDYNEAFRGLEIAFGDAARGVEIRIEALAYKIMSYAATRRTVRMVADYLAEHLILNDGQIYRAHDAAYHRLGAWRERLRAMIDAEIASIVEGKLRLTR